MEKKLSRRNQHRLALWQEDGAMSSWCRGNADRFDVRLSGLMASQHHRLLVSNHLERLFLMAESLENKAQLALNLLDAERDGRESTREKIVRIQDHARHLESIVENAISGAVSGITREIEMFLDEAFEKDAVHIRRKIVDFVHQASLNPAPYSDRLRETGIKKLVYLMFQDFRRDLDLFVMTDILPEINTLISEQEKRIQAYFQSLLDTYRIDPARISLAPDSAEETDILTRLADRQQGFEAYVDVQAIKKILGVTLPDMILLPRYSGRMQTRVLTGMGLSFVTRFFQTMLDRHASFSFSSGLDAAVRRIKKQVLHGADRQIEEFHTQVKYQYFTPLIQAVTRDVFDKVRDRFSMYESLDTDLAGADELDDTEKRHQRERVSGIISQLQQVRRNIGQLKQGDVHEHPVRQLGR
jgi:hypothetical protein